MGDLNQTKPDYSLELPRFIQHPFKIFALLALSVTSLYAFHPLPPIWTQLSAFVLSFFAVFYILIHRMLTNIINEEKRLEARERLLSEISLIGTERVLDVGCGSGIFLLGVAKKLTTGKAIGIEIWQPNSGDATKEQFWHNAKLEQVRERVSLEQQSICQLKFRDSYFHLITSSLTMHHLKSGKEYRLAIAEMKRVLKPRGQIVIYDEPFTILLCAKLMRKAGFQVERRYRDMLFAKNN